MIYRLFIITLMFIMLPALADSSYPPHMGESEWSFTVVAEPSDTFVVNDTDSATIDRELFSKDGSIYIDVPIRRYVGKTDASGYLLNVNDLVANGIVSETASIIIPAFDIDDEPFINDYYDCDGDDEIDEGLQHEVDEVFLNGEKIGILKGDSDVWQLNVFTVDISKIKFPSNPGETAINQFRVDIDTANWDVVLSSGAIGCDTGWSTAIDWIGVKYEAASPVIMVHGMNALNTFPNDTFDNFKVGLDNYYVVSDASINLTDLPTPDPQPVGCTNIPYNNSIDHNVDQLKVLIPSLAELYGTDSVHLVTHSKGGLDTRGFLSSTIGLPPEITLGSMGGMEVKQDLEALSLVTLNTPHQGSVLAVYGVEARQLTDIQAARAGFVYFVKKAEGSYYCDLTPARAYNFIDITALPTGIETASVATDADKNGDGEIGAGEGVPYDPGIDDYLYKLTGETAHVEITVQQGSLLPDEIKVNVLPTNYFLANDMIVTQISAGLYPLYPITGWHHINVHSTENAEAIATDALNSGIMDWRLR